MKTVTQLISMNQKICERKTASTFGTGRWGGEAEKIKLAGHMRYCKLKQAVHKYLAWL